MFPSFYILASKLCLISKLGYCRDHFICFPIIKIIVLHWLISDDLKTVVSYILSTFLIVSRWNINSVPIIFWMAVDVLTANYVLMLNLNSLILFSIFFLFYLDDRFNVDIWGMTIARHGEKLERMSWQMGNIVKEKGQELGMEWEQAVKCQILEKGTDVDYQSYLKSQILLLIDIICSWRRIRAILFNLKTLICWWALLIFIGPHGRPKGKV